MAAKIRPRPIAAACSAKTSHQRARALRPTNWCCSTRQKLFFPPPMAGKSCSAGCFPRGADALGFRRAPAASPGSWSGGVQVRADENPISANSMPESRNGWRKWRAQAGRSWFYPAMKQLTLDPRPPPRFSAPVSAPRSTKITRGLCRHGRRRPSLRSARHGRAPQNGARRQGPPAASSNISRSRSRSGRLAGRRRPVLATVAAPPMTTAPPAVDPGNIVDHMSFLMMAAAMTR